MDFAALKVQLEAARLVEVVADGATFKLRLPPEHEWRKVLEAHRDALGRVLDTRAMRALLDVALTDWSGVQARHFTSEGGEDEIKFSPAARTELLDVRQDLADVLAIDLAKRRRERRERLEAARKN